MPEEVLAMTPEPEPKLKKLTTAQQLELQQAENEALVHDYEALKRLFGEVLEDKRIGEHIRVEYTAKYIQVVDGAEGDVE